MKIILVDHKMKCGKQCLVREKKTKKVSLNFLLYDFRGNIFFSFFERQTNKRLRVFHTTVDQTSRACNSIYITIPIIFCELRLTQLGATLYFLHTFCWQSEDVHVVEDPKLQKCSSKHVAQNSGFASLQAVQ